MTASVDYYTYLASREWALRKRSVRERSGGVCERCKMAPHTETHHLTYQNLGKEPLTDLLGVCRGCHAFLSGRSDLDPASVSLEGENSVIEQYRRRGQSLPLTTGAFDDFNAEIKTAILCLEKTSPVAAVQLAQVMLEANRRIYQARRPD